MRLASIISYDELGRTLTDALPQRSQVAPDQWWALVAQTLGRRHGEQWSGAQIKGLARHYGLASFAQDNCFVHGCDKKPFCLGLCSKHYTRQRLHGTVEPPKHVRVAREAPCHPNQPHVAHGLCRQCYTKWRNRQMGARA